MEDNLKDFLKYIFEVAEDLERRNRSIKLTCPDCGMDYSEFKKIGKLGCSGCYTAFRDPISAALKNIHGSDEYRGKIPKGMGEKFADLLIKRELSDSRKSLKKAIEQEEYEEAARLRDAITDLKARLPRS